MTSQWIGTGILGVCVVAGPCLANGIWRRGRPRSLGYTAGIALILVGVLAARLLGGFPNALH